MATVQFEQVSFTHHGAQAPTLKDVSLTVQSGEFVVLCGASGSGKTTLLSLLKPVLTPRGERGGRVLLDGREITALSPREAATEVGFVMQHPQEQVVCDTVLRELCFGAENVGLPAQTLRRRVAETADVFGLSARLSVPTASLSSGQLQQLALASVTVLSPKVIVLDEPTASLDPVAAGRFAEWLVRLNRDYALTVLVAAHCLDDLLPHADRLVVLEKGQVVFNGAPCEAVAAPNGAWKALLPASFRLAARLSLKQAPLTVRDGKRVFAGQKALALPPPTAAHTETVLSADEVWFRYQKDSPDVLKGASLTLHKGERMCLFGGNGSGKSTLLSCLGGVRKPYHGKMRLASRAVYVPQDVRVMFGAPTVREDLEAVAAHHRGGVGVEEAASLLGIEAILDRHPYDVSGGQRRLAALALALVSDAQVLLLDEPTCSLDAFARERLRAALSCLCERGAAVLCATHDAEFAASTAHVCALLFDGAVIASAPPSDFFADNRFYAPPLTRMIDGALSAEQVEIKEGRGTV